MAATEEGLRFLLEGDVAQFERAMKDAETSATNAANGIVKASKQIAGTGNFINSLHGNIKTLADDLKIGQARFVAYSNSVDKTGKIIQNFQKQSNSGAAGLTSFSRIVQDAPFGIIGIGNNITQLAEQMQFLVAQTGSLKGAVQAMSASFLGAGGIVLAVSLLTTGLTFLAQRQQAQASAAKKAKEDNKSLAQTLLESEAAALGQVQAIRNLGAAVTDTNKSYQERKAALNELQRIDKDYFRGLSVEKSSYEQIKVAVDNYADSLIRTATIKGLQEQITKTAEAIAKQAPIIGKGLKQLAQDQNPFAQFVQDQAKDTGTAAVQLQGAFTRLDSIIVKGGKKTAADIGNVGALQLQAISKIAPLDELKNRLRGFTDALAEALGGINTPDKATAGKTISDVLGDLDKELKAINATFKVTDFSFESVNEQKITALNKAFGDLVKLGLSPTSAEIKAITAQINTLAASLTDITSRDKLGKRLFDTRQIFQFDKKQITDPTGLQNERLVIRLPITVDRAEILKGAADAAAKLREGINFISGEAVDASNNLRKTLNATLNSAVADGIGNIAGAIGEALGSGNIQGVFAAFANSIASFLSQMGTILIAEGIALEAFKASLESFQGVPAILAGSALVLAASAFRAFVAGGSNSFAGGGTAFGPQLMAIGDNTTQKEHVLSDLQLQKIARDAGIGNGGDAIAETRISGTNLVILLRRAGYNLQRING